LRTSTSVTVSAWSCAPRWDKLPAYQLTDTSADEMHKGIQLICPTPQYLNDAYADYLRGEPAKDPAIVAMTFSRVDPTLAPAGKNTLFLWGQYYPYKLRGGQDWDDIAEREAHKLFSVMDRFAPARASSSSTCTFRRPR
jgi:phytoene dehydrogenase-like protein